MGPYGFGLVTTAAAAPARGTAEAEARHADAASACHVKKLARIHNYLQQIDTQRGRAVRLCAISPLSKRSHNYT